MGTLKSTAAIGVWKGKVGNVVLSSWNGIYTIRIAPTRKSTTKQSEKQSSQNTTFSLVMAFLSAVTDVIKIGFQRTRKTKMTPLNMATSYHMLKAMADDLPEPAIDLTKVKFSKPIKSTQCAWNAALFAEEGRVIKVTWELNPFPLKCTQLDDQVVFVIYDSDVNWLREFLPGPVQRDTQIFTMVMPQNCIGHKCFIYMFLVSTDRKLVSETEYLGMVKIIA